MSIREIFTKESLARLTFAAREINAASDELNDTLSRLDDLLKSLGVEEMSTVAIESVEREILLRFDKGLMIVTPTSSWPILKAPRELRVRAVDAFPLLFEEMRTSAEMLLKKIARPDVPSPRS